MSVRKHDLRLAVVFDAMMSEQSVSGAARRLNLSQPAVSHALRTLRDHLGDELFVPEGRLMVPTQKAREIAPLIRDATDLLSAALHGASVFDPEITERHFKIALPDYLEVALLPKLSQVFSSEAPSAVLSTRNGVARTQGHKLRLGHLDVAFDVKPLAGNEFQAELALEEELVAMMRAKGAPKRLSKSEYAKRRHVMFNPMQTGAPPFGRISPEDVGMHHLPVRVSNVLSLPFIVAESDMICTLPRRIAEGIADRYNLKIYPHPYVKRSVAFYLIWHQNYDGDQGHAWLRNHLLELCGSL